MVEIRSNALFNCRNCRNLIAFRNDLMAKSGHEYMFSHAMNIIVGQHGDEQLLSGLYSIADISCNNCGEVIGWKYVRAYNESQRFKEGKVVLVLAKIAKLY